MALTPSVDIGRRLCTTLAAGVLVITLDKPASGQLPDVAFEAASVKPNRSDAQPLINITPQGTVTITNVPLRNVIVNAYRVPQYRVLGGPDWLATEHFDIVGKPREGVATGRGGEMLQRLLADRFKLVVHRELREMPIYTLALSNPGALGPKLKRSSRDCQAETAAGRGATADANTTDAPCRAVVGTGVDGGGILLVDGRALSIVPAALSNVVRRTIVDRTGLQGLFDIELRWSADLQSTTSTSDTPSLYTALQEQLGLKLEPSRGPVDLLIIDSVERPSPD